MLFKDYVKSLNDLLIEKPEAADYMVITSIDDEGNGYNAIHFKPSLGKYDENQKDFESNDEPNSVCVN